MIGTDSHTPNAGGLGMVAIGVGGADAVDVMTGFPFNVRWPKVIGVKLTGTLSGWSRAEGRDPRGRPGAHGRGRHRRDRRVLRPGRRHDLGHRQGARSATWVPRSAPPAALFGYDHNMAMYLKATGREAIADAADKVADDLRPDDGALYDQLIEIDLDELKPLINGPHSPDRAHRVGAAASAPRPASNDWPLEISAALDRHRAPTARTKTSPAPRRSPARPSARGLKAKTELLVTPGSEQIRATIERDGLLADLEAIGATVLANACGPCIGQWDRPPSITGRAEHDRQLVQPQLPEAQRRLGQHAQLRHLARHGDRARARRARLDFDPTTDTITAPDGTEVLLEPPVGEVLPDAGLRPGREHVHRRRPPTAPGSRSIGRPTSDRLQLLQPFPAWDGNDYYDLPMLMKAQGQVHHRPHLGRRQVAQVPRPSREHHRQPVPRRRQRVHRPVGEGVDFRDGSPDTLPNLAKHYERGRRPLGRDRRPQLRRGSSREHAAMEPRFRGGVVILARSFARIHETN